MVSINSTILTKSEFDEPQYSANLEREIIVFSGFRDVILAARIEQTGGTIVPGIRKDVTRLLVLNASASPTGKVKKKPCSTTSQSSPRKNSKTVSTFQLTEISGSCITQTEPMKAVAKMIKAHL